jgi:diguanylate cyclase (GGDEF)-like protein/PAS domain S-box-containing protein
MTPYDNAFLATVMDQLIDAVCVVDVQGRFLFVSAAGQSIFGFTSDEMLGRRMIELVHPDDRARTLNAVVEIVAGTHRPNFENRYVRKDGSVVHIMWTARWSPDQNVRVAVARDVTEHRRAENMRGALYAISEAAHGSGDLDEMFSHIHDILGTMLSAAAFSVALFDSRMGLLDFAYHADGSRPPPPPQTLRDAALSASIVRSGEALLLRPEDRIGSSGASPAADIAADTVDWLGVPLKGRLGITGALVVQNRAGQPRYGQADLELLQFVSTQIATAIERKQWEARLRHAAQHDALTGLPNRALLLDRLQKALSRARRDALHLAVLFIDLDRFKQVNDRLGHSAGDLLLQQTARRIKDCVRDADTVGRMGGDEFLVLLGDMPMAEHAGTVAEKILAALVLPYDLDGQFAQVSPSIGWASAPVHGDDHQQLIRLADEAMYIAKRAGGHRVVKAAVDADNPPVLDKEIPGGRVIAQDTTEHLFSYGALQLEAVQLATFGRLLNGRPDRLPGYSVGPSEITDTDMFAARNTGDGNQGVAGTVFALTAAELLSADAREAAGCRRDSARLASGLQAWVYVDAR